MGFISTLVKQVPSGRADALWRRAFGEDKETPARKKPVDDRSNRTLQGSDAAVKRFLMSLRTKAPSGWTDDRWEQSRHFTGINYVAIHRLGKQLSMAEFRVYKRDVDHPDGKRPITPEDPPEGDRVERPWRLVELMEKPNWKDNFGRMMYRWNQQKMLTGIARAWMVPNELGTPCELYCIPTALAYPGPQVLPQYPDGYFRIQSFYPNGPYGVSPTPQTSAGAEIDARWMIEFQEPHPLIFQEGYSPLTAMRLEMDEFESIGRSRWYKMRNSINPSATLNSTDKGASDPLPAAEIARIHAEWENEFQGPHNHGKLIVGAPGYQLDEWGARPAEMDYPQGWDQLMGFILGGGFGITKPAAGMIEDSSYATLFATLKQLHLITLDPECSDYAGVLTRRLAPFFGDDLIVEIRTPRIDDHDIMFTKLDKMLSLKGMPATVVKFALKMMDIEMPEELVEELSKAGGEGAAPGGPVGGAPGAPPGQGQASTAPPPPPLAKPEDEEEESAGPDTGRLGKESLGPKDILHERKSFWKQRAGLISDLRKDLGVSRNGKH